MRREANELGARVGHTAGMAPAKPFHVLVGDHPVTCAFCHFDAFHLREVLLNTGGMSFLGLDFANVSSKGLICAQCGYLMEFVNDGITVRPVP